MNASLIDVIDSPVIESEPFLLSSIFLNLFNNSIKFQKPDNIPRIIVDIKEEHSFVKIQLEDNGIGFPEDQKESIFEHFYKLHDRAQYEGCGMGLAICKKIIERHGGSISASSTLGEGSLFTINLPMMQSHIWETCRSYSFMLKKIL